MDILADIKDVFKDRFKGAFGGTFILVWLVMNWELVYMLFNFDADCTYNDKLNEINEYMRGAWPKRMLCYPIMWSIASIITYSSFNHLSILITATFSERVKPYFLKWAGSKKIVTRESKDLLEEQYFNLQEQYDNRAKVLEGYERTVAELKKTIDGKDFTITGNEERYNQTINHRNEEYNKLQEANMLLSEEFNREKTIRHERENQILGLESQVKQLNDNHTNIRKRLENKETELKYLSDKEFMQNIQLEDSRGELDKLTARYNQAIKERDDRIYGELIEPNTLFNEYMVFGRISEFGKNIEWNSTVHFESIYEDGKKTGEIVKAYRLNDETYVLQKAFYDRDKTIQEYLHSNNENGYRGIDSEGMIVMYKRRLDLRVDQLLSN